VVTIVADVEPRGTVVIPVAVIGVEEPAVRFMRLRAGLHTSECQQADAGRPHEREKLCTHWQSGQRPAH